MNEGLQNQIKFDSISLVTYTKIFTTKLMEVFTTP